jgi:hypothetical protein
MGVGEKINATVPRGGMKKPRQKSNTDVDDKATHRKKDFLVKNFFCDKLNPSIRVPPDAHAMKNKGRRHRPLPKQRKPRPYSRQSRE